MPKMNRAAALLEEALNNAKSNKFRAGFARNDDIDLECHVYSQNRQGREVFYNKWTYKGDRVSKAHAFAIGGMADA